MKKLRFAPGKGNSKLFVLYSTRLDIRDAQRVSSQGVRAWSGGLGGLGNLKRGRGVVEGAQSCSLSPQDVLLSHMKWGGKELGGGLVVEDVDWATSDQPMLLTSDGVVRVYDLSLQICQSDFTLASFNSQCTPFQSSPGSILSRVWFQVQCSVPIPFHQLLV